VASALPDDLMGTVENVCGAHFLSEKIALFSDTRRLLNHPVFSTYLYDIYGIDSEEGVVQWLAESIPAPDEFLLKFLLFRGFYMSDTKDLRDYVDEALSLLEEDVLSSVIRRVAIPEPIVVHH
jgi:hypothetical protein